MAFHTPQATGMKDRQHQYQMYLQQQQQQQQQPFSLLFSPPPGGSPAVKKTSDKPKQSPVHNIPNIFEATPGSTPRSRRRSMTPASSMAKDTPPPPPGQGLLDSPGFPGPLTFGAMYGATPHGASKEQDGYGAEDMAVSPAEVPQRQAFSAILQEPSGYVTADLSLQTLEDHEPTLWVTVFGFNQPDAALVIGEFSKCGEIVDFGTFDDGPGVNWMHIKYSNKHDAQRALLRNGDQLSATCMVGVKRMERSKELAIDHHQSGPPEIREAKKAIPPKASSSRPYQVHAAASAVTFVPLSSKSTWDKVMEFILGLR